MTDNSLPLAHRRDGRERGAPPSVPEREALQVAIGGREAAG